MSKVVLRGEMKEVGLRSIKMMALIVKYELWAEAIKKNRDVKLYLHWSAGHYKQFSNAYHIQIDRDGAYYVQAGSDFAAVLDGTYMRNNGSIAIALCCAAGATTDDLGDCPPTKMQIEAMARVVAVLSDVLDLTIDRLRVMTHGEAADNEDGVYPPYEDNGQPDGMYGPKHSCERWDLEYLGTPDSPRFDPYGSRGGDILRGKAAWYRKTYPDGVEKHF